MNRIVKGMYLGWAVFATVAIAVWSAPAWAGDYDSALKGVKKVDAVFDVSHGDAKTANVIFWAVRDAYANDTVRKFPEASRVVAVFHGPAVALLSTARDGLKEEEARERDAFVATLREMKKEGVKLEVCMYAVKVMGVDPATLIPEVDRVPNGFVSVIGYQNQGYGVVAIP